MRLQRIGRKNFPSYRIVVTVSTTGPKSNKYVERVGSYNPLIKQKIFEKERITYWISKGVVVSSTLHNMFISEGIIEGKKRNVLPKKTPIIKEKPESAPKVVVTETKEEAPSVEEAPAPEEAQTPNETSTPEEAPKTES